MKLGWSNLTPTLVVAFPARLSLFRRPSGEVSQTSSSFYLDPFHAISLIKHQGRGYDTSTNRTSVPLRLTEQLPQLCFFIRPGNNVSMTGIPPLVILERPRCDRSQERRGLDEKDVPITYGVLQCVILPTIRPASCLNLGYYTWPRSRPYHYIHSKSPASASPQLLCTSGSHE